MAKWRHSKILIYFADTFGSGEENCLPYMPENFTCNVPGRNEEIDVLHASDEEYGKAGTLNLLKRPGLKTWSIDCFFNHPEKPMYAEVRQSSKWTPQFWVDFIESAMYQRKVLEMTITGLDIVTYVTVESFKHTKEAGEELDTYYTIDLKEYQFNEIQEEEINIKQEMPPKNTGNTSVKPTEPNIEAKVWLIGPAYKSNWGMASENPRTPYIWLFTNGTKVVEGLADFKYLPVKVIERKTFNGSDKIEATGLGNHIIQYWKIANPNILLGGTITYLGLAIKDAWYNHDELHEYFNAAGRQITDSDISQDSALVNEQLLPFLNKKLGVTYNLGQTLPLKTFSELLKEFFNTIELTNTSFTYNRKSQKPYEICQCESLVEFKLNDNNKVGNVVTTYPVGTKLWTYGNKLVNGSSYVTIQNNGNIPFTVSGINKDLTNFRTKQFE